MNDANIEKLLNSAKQLRRDARFEEAIALISIALHGKANDRLLQARARLFELNGMPNEAITDLDAAIELDPRNPRLYFNRGYVYSHALNDNEAAVKNFRQAVALGSNDASTHQECCLSLLLLRNPTEALQHARFAETLSPDDYVTYFCLGEAQLSLGQYEDAVESLSKAAQLAPDADEHWSALGRARMELGGVAELEHAEADFGRAIEIDPETADYFYSRGQVRLLLGKNKEAIGDLKNAIELNPDPINRSQIERRIQEAQQRSV